LTRALYRLGQICNRHRVPVLVIWLVAVVFLGVLSRGFGLQTNNDLTLPGTDSQDAQDLLSNKFPSQANGINQIVFKAPSGHKLTESRYQQAVAQVTKAYTKDPQVRQAISPFSSSGSDQLNKAQTIGYISLNLKPGAGELTDKSANRLIDRDKPLEQAGLDVAADGYLGQTVSSPSTNTSVVVGLIAAVVILLFTFGTAVAMGVPITTAILGLVAGMSAITLLSHEIDVPTAAPAVATMIGLGVGIDYSLFIVSRHRAQLQEGMDVHESIARSVATAGGAVVFAGSTVTIALVSLMAAGIPLVTTLGYTSAIAVVVAVIGAITLLPAILSLLGVRINSLKLPGHQAKHDDRPHGWARWARFVVDHPTPSLLAGLALLLVLAIPVFSLTLGQEDNGSLPKDTQSRKSYDLLSEGFGAGTNGPILVAVDLKQPAQNNQKQLNQVKQQQAAQQAQEQASVQQLTQQLIAQGVPPDQAQQEATQQAQQEATQKNAPSQAQVKQQEEFLSSPASDPRLVNLRKDMQKTNGVQSVSLPLVNKQGTSAVYTVIATTAPSAEATTNLINRLRDDVIPKATKGQQMTAHVGGQTAGYIDLATQISDHLLRVIAIVLALSFVLLLLAFRSLVVPLKAVVMNVLSILAAFGIVTYVFQHHWSATLIGLDSTIPIVSYVPLMMFAILFGLSMDYEVFLMTHVRESWKETGDPHEAVVHGLASTARVITSAALIMVSVFSAFVINGDPVVKQFGLGMAAAVAVDATIIRCLMVPAFMSLIGRIGWWMPRWLDRYTPNLSIEGGEYFEERDRAAKQPAA
jgi:RND superfamily putative drug exporter